MSFLLFFSGALTGSGPPFTGVALTARPALCVTNRMLTATLTSTPAPLSGYPLSNLQFPSKHKVTRWNGATLTLTADFANALPQEIGVGILSWTNLTPTATIEFRYSSDGFVSENVLVGSISGGAANYRLGYPLFLTTSVSRRYCRWVITDTANPQGFLEIGMAYAGPVLQLSRGLSEALGIELFDGAARIRSPVGIPFASPGGKWRGVKFTPAGLTEAEAWGTWHDLLLTVGKGQDFFLVLFPAHTNADIVRRTTYYGAFTELGRIQRLENSYGVFGNESLLFVEQ